ncbi:MAG: right-handed parallel beta-helix repeat-containing protein [Deltaproteobacteria bacterium]|nr:right-handed parallel beta-helix repeat-containing protein [Deltaproteobacteria bacterium]
MKFFTSMHSSQKSHSLIIVLILNLAFFAGIGISLSQTPTHGQCLRYKLPTTNGPSITVNNLEELENAIREANAKNNITILLEDGVYDLKRQVFIKGNNVTIRSGSGNRKNVIIRGKGMAGSIPHIFEVVGKNFTAADLTIGGVKYHGIQIHGENNADGPLIHNLRILDTGQQMIKVSHNSKTGTGADKGIVEWCSFEYSAGVGPDYYIGGIDAHHAGDWVVRNNHFQGIRSPEKALAEYAIHFWSESSNTLVEKNTIVACDRGIGFGLGDRGHQGGMIRNNMIFTTRDVGIGLENSSNTKIYNNTIYSLIYRNSIEYRFLRSRGISIINNLTNAPITARNGGKATLSNNVTDAKPYWFIGADRGDLHLNGTIQGATNRGLFLTDVLDDIDCESRIRSGSVDVGADERILYPAK